MKLTYSVDVAAGVYASGAVRELCSLAPNNVNTMAAAALAAHNLGFDHVTGCLISDPTYVTVFIVGMGDTDDTSIYRDTKISRYWYRVCLDTFWYRDTKSIAILCRYFCRYYTCSKTFNTLFL